MWRINQVKWLSHYVWNIGAIKSASLTAKTKNSLEKNCNDEDENEVMELPIFDMKTIIKATENFSIDKKLGEGGFGTVYKVISC